MNTTMSDAFLIARIKEYDFEISLNLGNNKTAKLINDRIFEDESLLEDLGDANKYAISEDNMALFKENKERTYNLKGQVSDQFLMIEDVSKKDVRGTLISWSLIDWQKNELYGEACEVIAKQLQLSGKKDREFYISPDGGEFTITTTNGMRKTLDLMNREYWLACDPKQFKKEIVIQLSAELDHLIQYDLEDDLSWRLYKQVLNTCLNNNSEQESMKEPSLTLSQFKDIRFSIDEDRDFFLKLRTKAEKAAYKII